MPNVRPAGHSVDSPRRWSDAPVIGLFLLGLAVYLLLFFRAGDQRAEAVLVALLPDQLLMSWIGGNLGRIGLLDRLFVLGFAGLILLLSGVWGWLSLGLVRADRYLVPLERLVFSVGLGLGQLSLLTLLVGLSGALRPAWVMWLLILLPPAGAATRHWRRTPGMPAQTPPPGAVEDPSDGAPSADRFTRYGWWIAVPFLWLIVLGGMLPPWEFDVREYHLQVPKEWFVAGRIEFLPHNVYGNMPLAAEIHALLAMVLVEPWADWWWGALVGKTVMAAFAPLTGLALVAAGRRTISPRGGVAAGLIYLSTPWVIYVAVTGLNENAIACYSLLASYAMLIWQGAPGTAAGAADPARLQAGTSRRIGDFRHGLLAVAGFLAGAAAACKYPALLFTLLPLLAWCVWTCRANPWKPAAVFLLSGLAAVGPWYAKNAVFTGNPVYPLVFGGQTRTPQRMAQWNRAHRVPLDEHGRRYSPAQAGGAVVQIGWQSRWTSPLLIPFLILAPLAGRRWTAFFTFAALLAWGVSVWWLATHRIDRFLVPLLPWAAWLAASGFAWSTSRSWRGLATGLLIAGASYNWLYFVSSGQYDPRLLVSLHELRRDEPDEPGGPSRIAPVHRYLNDHVPPGSRVLLVGDAQPFDLEAPVWYATCFDECLFERLMRDRSRDQRLAALQQHRISHIYVDWAEIARYRSPGNYGFSDYVTPARLLELVEQGLLRRVPLELGPRAGALFEVIRDAQRPG